MLNRENMMTRAFDDRTIWDLLIVGGGATGVGAAVDAAARGYRTLLLEQSDFGKGTSSRSTKLVHGGVRYLQQGNLALVIEALHERGILHRNAPHLVHDLAFIVPTYDWWEGPFYGIGLKVYDLLAGRYGFGRSRRLSPEQVLERLPTLDPRDLRGGVLYHDGQFDDARLLINLVRTAAKQGATMLNYVRVTALSKNEQGMVDGVVALDGESGQQRTIRARCVINATGAFSDAVRKLNDPAAGPMTAPSQGVHVVLDRSFLPGDTAIMVPRTRDHRVLFAIPWHGHTMLGTTDTPIEAASLEPRPFEQELTFILDTAADYLAKAPSRDDIRSMWAGVRPLVRAGHGEGENTAGLSRDHTIHIAPSGLLTILGGKWTTYRKMAEDCIDQAARLADLPSRDCPTGELRIHGCQQPQADQGDLSIYGSDAAAVDALIREDPSLGRALPGAPRLCGAQVVWAAREEMARTVEDVLARRTRLLMLDARAAQAAAPAVARLLAGELGRDDAWQRSQIARFTALARQYLPA